MKPTRTIAVILAVLSMVFWATNSDGKNVTARSEFFATAAQQALDRYLAEIEDIERIATLRKGQARQRLAVALQQTQRAEQEPGPRYNGMLGSYYNNKGRIPYIMLSVPNGKNVLSLRQKAAMNASGASTEPLYKFESRGHVKIPAKGMYRLETGRGYGQVQLNGISYRLSQRKAGEPLRAEVELDQGIYEVYYSVGNNGGQMNYAHFRIEHAETKKELPIFVYDADLKKFWHDLSLGVELTETSGWTKKKHRLK